MKKTLCMVLALVLLVGATVMPCMATAADCIGVISKKAGFTSYDYRPMSTEDSIIRMYGAKVDNELVRYYSDVEKLVLTYDCDTEDMQNLVLLCRGDDAAPIVPTSANIEYIWQTEPEDGKVSFTIYPSDFQVGKYAIFVAQTGESCSQVATFEAAVKDTRITTDSEFKMGDVNNNGEYDATDSLWALQMFVGIAPAGKEWTEQEILRANVDGDKTSEGKPLVTASDSLFILQKSVGITTVF